jgi:hypothetical protein
MAECAVCASPQRAEIEAMLAAGESQRGVIRRMGDQGVTLYRPSLAAHARHMQEAADPRAAELEELAAGTVAALRAEAGQAPAMLRPVFLEAAEEAQRAAEGKGSTIDGLVRALETINRQRPTSAATDFQTERLRALFHKHKLSQGADVDPGTWAALVVDAKAAPALFRPLYLVVLREVMKPSSGGKLIKAVDTLARLSDSTAASERLEFLAAFGARAFQRFE